MHTIKCCCHFQHSCCCLFFFHIFDVSPVSRLFKMNGFFARMVICTNARPFRSVTVPCFAYSLPAKLAQTEAIFKISPPSQPFEMASPGGNPSYLNCYGSLQSSDRARGFMLSQNADCWCWRQLCVARERKVVWKIFTGNGCSDDFTVSVCVYVSVPSCRPGLGFCKCTNSCPEMPWWMNRHSVRTGKQSTILQFIYALVCLSGVHGCVCESMWAMNSMVAVLRDLRTHLVYGAR